MKRILLVSFFFACLQFNIHAQKNLSEINKVQQFHKAQNKNDKGSKNLHKSDLTKKDGRPDMRYKVNQQNSVGPKKADGTLDRRFKQNKKPVKKS